MTPEGASAFALFALVASEGAVFYQDLSGGGLGSHGGAKRYLAIGIAGAAALLVAGVSPPLGAFAALLLMAATVYSTLGRAKGGPGITNNPSTGTGL